MPRGKRSAKGARSTEAMSASGATDRVARADRADKVAKGKPGRKPGRRASSGDPDARLADIVSRYVSDLVGAVQNEVRRTVAEEVRAFLAGSARAGRKPGRRAAAGGVRRVVGCIAPGCTNPSKGPRFHYLCDKHKDSPKKDYEAWRLARKDKNAA